MSKTKKIGIWVVVVIAIIVVFAVFIRSKAPKTIYTTSDTVKGTLSQTVSVTGKLNANESINLNFETGGRIKQIFVKKGDKVAVGDKLAMIDNTAFNDQVAQAKAVLDKAVADAEGNNDAVREAKVGKDNAQNTLDDTRSLNDKNIDAAKAAVTNAQNYLDAAQTLYNNNPTDANKLTLVSAQNSLASTQQALKVAQNQADLNKTNAQNAVDSAEAKVKTAESDFAKESRSAAIENAKAGYDIALNNLAKVILKAPSNGQITQVNNKVGEILGATTMSSSGQLGAPFALMNSFDLIIDANVPESDISKIQLGQNAKVTFDAFTSQDVYQAQVIEIDPASTTIQDVVYYAIKLKVDNADLRLKAGMSANIDIKTGGADNVLMIPLRAVKTDSSNNKTVDVLQSDNTVKTVKIQTGLQGDEGLVEVKNGIKEGDKVVTFVQTK
ncbi:MAG TPA: biotin/lipoyl-binding protein [Patescibacteria group bacterium]